MAKLYSHTTTVRVHIGAQTAILNSTQCGWHRVAVDLSCWSTEERKALAEVVRDEEGATVPERSLTIADPSPQGLLDAVRAKMAHDAERAARIAADKRANEERAERYAAERAEATKHAALLAECSRWRLSELAALDAAALIDHPNRLAGQWVWKLAPLHDYLVEADAARLRAHVPHGGNLGPLGAPHLALRGAGQATVVVALPEAIGQTTAQLEELQNRVKRDRERERLIRLASWLRWDLMVRGLEQDAIDLDAAARDIEIARLGLLGLPVTRYREAEARPMTLEEFRKLTLLEDSLRARYLQAKVSRLWVSSLWVRLINTDGLEVDDDGDLKIHGGSAVPAVRLTFGEGDDEVSFEWPIGYDLKPIMESMERAARG